MTTLKKFLSDKGVRLDKIEIPSSSVLDDTSLYSAPPVAVYENGDDLTEDKNLNDPISRQLSDQLVFG
jgi:hypothetical protein